ncbi:hypothetical protein Tco_0005665 [Tanacetum coccineum]
MILSISAMMAYLVEHMMMKSEVAEADLTILITTIDGDQISFNGPYMQAPRASYETLLLLLLAENELKESSTNAVYVSEFEDFMRQKISDELMGETIIIEACQSLTEIKKKSTTGGCQFLGRRLISWQCKKQTIMANSTTEAEYVAAANCCRQVLWIQNQMMDYGFNFMNTKIHIDNESTICIVKNPVYHQDQSTLRFDITSLRDAIRKD